MRVAVIAALTLAGCGPHADGPIANGVPPAEGPSAGRRTSESTSAVELGHDGLRGLEYGEAITQAAIDRLLPAGVMRREDRPGGTTVYTIEEQVGEAGVRHEAIQIFDHDPVGAQRQVTIHSPRMSTALGVRPGDRLAALAKHRRVRCTPQSQTLLDCDVPGTRFSLRTRGSELSVEEMVANAPDLARHPDHAIVYIEWLGPVRSRELRAQSLERGTIARGGVAVVRMPVARLAPLLPRGALVREQRTGDEVELVVELAGRPFLRFVTYDNHITEVVVQTPDIATAHGIRVGDLFGRELGATSRVTCWVIAEQATWHARCDNGDVELVLESHPGAAPGGGGDHATVPPGQVAGDRIVEIRSQLH